jgi:hypothetical protein
MRLMPGDDDALFGSTRLWMNDVFSVSVEVGWMIFHKPFSCQYIIVHVL